MPSSQVFGVNNRGRVYSLSTDQSTWQELPYLGVEFKRISAHETVIWALGGDHQVYVFVYGSSVPIRVCEESYENQRWNPIEGFSGILLPTDRPTFSSADGLKSRALSGITLPTLAWSWESAWHLHHTHEGQALDKEAWTYSIDFPRSYTAEKRWNSCVRRRKWVRYRRYVALDTWSAVPPIHQDHTEEPFIDICVGGGEVPGDDPDKLMVWGVTVLGRVMVRTGVDGTCPEGCHWLHIPTPPDQDVTSVYVGRSGRVWAVTWDGTALVRTGITRDTPTGEDWEMVDAPEGSHLQQVAVGVQSVWAVTRDHRVWFRRGLQDSPGKNKGTGSSWLMMVGQLNMLTVGPNDQVWGVSSEDHTVVIRTGVTEIELTGRTWRPINLPLNPHGTPVPSPSPSPSPILLNRPSSSSSSGISGKANPVSIKGIHENFQHHQGSPNPSVASSDQTSDSIDFTSMESALKNLEIRETPQININEKQQDGDASSKEGERDGEKDSIQKEGICNISIAPDEGTETQSYNDSQESSSIKIRYPEDYPSSLSSSTLSDTGDSLRSPQINYECPVPVNSIIPNLGDASDDTPDRKNQKDVDSDISVNKYENQREVFESSVIKDSSNVSNANSVKENDHQEQLCTPQASNSSGEWSESRLRHASSSSGGSSEIGLSQTSLVVPRGDGPNYNLLALEADHLWLWIAGGGCWVQANNLPKWFLSEGSPKKSHEPWRAAVHEKLHERHLLEIEPYIGYEEAVEGSSWVISGQCRWWAGGQWVPASLELVMVGSRRSEVQDATLNIQYTLGSERLEEMSCCSLLMSVMYVEPAASRSVVAIYLPSAPLRPKTLIFSAETEAEEWLNHLSTACNQFRGLTGRPSAYAIWGVTTQGDVFLHDSSVTEEELRVESVAAHQQLPIGTGSTPIVCLLDRGFRPGCFISVSGKIHAKADQFHINLQTSRGTEADYALHVNPRFNQEIAVVNTKAKGKWGRGEDLDLKNLAPDTHCEISIVCDDKDFKISINDKFWCSFKHRVSVAKITHVVVRGNITVESLAYNYGAGERQLSELYWRGLGGHLLRVESGAGGVTWAISYDYHVYTYTGATGGGLYKGNNNDVGVQVMSDVRHSYVWENQRWNPVTGFTHRGLPTDRHTWSDQSGRYQRTREGTKLQSRHWSWTSEWCIDYHTPGGVDREGWQYATDFPMSYHSHRYVTDLVRRRRWVRKCRISTSGPWRQMEKVALVHVSVSPEYAADGTVPVWGVSISGEVVIRRGVTPEKYEGEKWSLVPAECPMSFVCAGIGNCGVWAVSKDGRAHLRLGVTKGNPHGLQWVNIDAPSQPLVEVAAGAGAVWGLDQGGSLFRRKSVLPLFPEGTSWEYACSSVTSISIDSNGTLWAVLESYDYEKTKIQGVIARRVGVSDSCPIGTGWEHTLGTGWRHVCARVPMPL